MLKQLHVYEFWYIYSVRRSRREIKSSSSVGWAIRVSPGVEHKLHAHQRFHSALAHLAKQRCTLTLLGSSHAQKTTLRLSTTSQIMHARAKHNTASHLIHVNSCNMTIKPTQKENVCQKTHRVRPGCGEIACDPVTACTSATQPGEVKEANLAHYSTKNNTT